jgi:hypothetical protein
MKSLQRHNSLIHLLSFRQIRGWSVVETEEVAAKPEKLATMNEVDTELSRCFHSCNLSGLARRICTHKPYS